MRASNVEVFEHRAVRFANLEELLESADISDGNLDVAIRRATNFNCNGFVRSAGSILVWTKTSYMRTDEVIAAMAKDDYEPDDMESQFVLAVSGFRLCVEEPVVALKQNGVFSGKNASTLFVRKGRKCLELRPLITEWDRGCRFVVRPIDA